MSIVVDSLLTQSLYMEKSRIDLPIGITLDRFIKSNQSQYPNAAGDLSQLLRDIALASKVVNREINKAGLLTLWAMWV